MPKVSVILTSYNCALYLDQAIESIVGQTFGDLDLLISDDGSTDGSQDKLRDWAARESRIRLFLQPTNLGLVRNYNFLFGQAAGDYVAIQDADDWSDETRLAKQVAMLEDEAFVLCATGGVFHFPATAGRRPDLEPSRIVDGAFDEFPSIPASTLFRRSMLEQFPGWSEYFAGGTSMDRYFLMDLLDGRKGFHIGEPLYHARVRSGSNHRTWSERNMVTHQLFLELKRQRQTTGSDALRDGDFATLERLEGEFRRDPTLRSASLRESAVINVDCGNYRAAARLLCKSLALNPMSGLTWRSGIYLARSWIGRAARDKAE